MSSNISRFYLARYQAALDLYDTDEHGECITILGQLLLEPGLSWATRWKANMVMFGALDDWHEKESYRLDAVDAARECRKVFPTGKTTPSEEAELLQMEEDLEEFASDQALSKPSVESPSAKGDSSAAGTPPEASPSLPVGPSDESPPGSSPPPVDTVREESPPVGAPRDVLPEMNYTMEMFESSQPTAQSEPNSNQIGKEDLSESDAPSLTGPEEEEDEEVTLSALQLQSPQKRPHPDADASGSAPSNKRARN